jgi:hypothetical protein
VDEMQQWSLPAFGPTARMTALSLLVALVLTLTLVLAQLAAREAPDPPPPSPPMQVGLPGGHAMAQ